jgi:hypothetical protein
LDNSELTVPATGVVEIAITTVLAAREVAMALIIIARATRAPAMSLGGLADLLKSVATALDTVGSAFVRALTLRRGG